MMVSSPCKCAGDTGRACNRFLPAMDKDPYTLCTDNSRIGKGCSTVQTIIVVFAAVGLTRCGQRC